jgi:hypothetical protein
MKYKKEREIEYANECEMEKKKKKKRRGGVGFYQLCTSSARSLLHELIRKPKTFDNRELCLDGENRSALFQSLFHNFRSAL